jgi:hypothetical protein
VWDLLRGFLSGQRFHVLADGQLQSPQARVPNSPGQFPVRPTLDRSPGFRRPDCIGLLWRHADSFDHAPHAGIVVLRVKILSYPCHSHFSLDKASAPRHLSDWAALWSHCVPTGCSNGSIWAVRSVRSSQSGTIRTSPC